MFTEVEQAAKLVREVGKGRVIDTVVCFEDRLVFEGITGQEFTGELQGRRLLDAKRYGKYFYLELEGSGRMPVLHLGMTGYLQAKGRQPHQYAQRKKPALETWPPRFTKFVLRFQASKAEVPVEIAYSDARRLGRVRLRLEPLAETPIASLGFDPLISMPPLGEYSQNVTRRKCPIKSLLLDQTFNAGVGNWVADEILFHSGIHPERRSHNLSPEEIEKLYHNTQYVCKTAVDVDADSSRFPEHWLFNHRWSKGKGKGSDKVLLLATGKSAKIDWITVGGRTSAFVIDVQHLSRGSPRKKLQMCRSTVSQDDGFSSLTSEESSITT